MKTTLLLLLSLFCFTSFGQNLDLTNSCGNTVFDLTVNNAIITNGNSDLEVTFYFSQTDALIGTSAIENPENFDTVSVLPMIVETIYARVDPVLEDMIIISFNLITTSQLNISIGGSLDVPQSYVFAMVSGGQAPFSYQWSFNNEIVDGATEETFNLPGVDGMITVSITDANGCIGIGQTYVQGYQLYVFDEAFSVFTGNDVTISVSSVLSNDYLDGVSIQNGLSQISVTPLNFAPNFQLQPNGKIAVLPGTLVGTYTLDYQICVAGNAICDIGTATVTVVNQGFVLNAFVDTNGNEIQDNDEVNFTLGQFHYETNDSGIVNDVVSSSGNFILSESNAANLYDFTFTIDPAYAQFYTLATASYSDISVTSGIETYNFAVTSIPYTDLSVNITNYGMPPRPGFMYQNQILYHNYGNQIISGTLTFQNDTTVSINSVTQSGVTMTADGFTYAFENLQPNETRTILVFMQVPTIPTVALGDLVTNSVAIILSGEENATENNSSSIAQTIVGSYDPNDKHESNGGQILHSGFTETDYLTYKIQFENTGTANAENVKVVDVLDAQLDENSVRMVGASSNYTLQKTGTTLTWNFNGIELPPSVEDTMIGHGYIIFEVKPKPGYAIGDIISNTASIYFDFNPAIVTNTFTTEFVAQLGVDDFEENTFTLYPNPVKDMLNISSTLQFETIKIFNMLGQTVIEKNSNNTQTAIDCSSLQSGIYMVKIVGQNSEKTIRIIKE